MVDRYLINLLAEQLILAFLISTNGISEQLKKISAVLTVNGSDSEAVDVDILTAKLPEKGGILERDGERRCLPVLNIITESDRPQDRNVNVFEESQIGGCVDAVGFILKENHRSSIIALLRLLD